MQQYIDCPQLTILFHCNLQGDGRPHRFKTLDEITCFKCGENGHFANKCPKVFKEITLVFLHLQWLLSMFSYQPKLHRIMRMDYFQGHLAFLSNNQSKWICNILCGLPYSHLLGGASTLPPSINVHHHTHSSHIYLCQHAAPVIICYHAFTIVEWCYQWTLSSMIHHQMFVEVDRTRGVGF